MQHDFGIAVACEVSIQSPTIPDLSKGILADTACRMARLAWRHTSDISKVN
jgi:hypothetical protein